VIAYLRAQLAVAAGGDDDELLPGRAELIGHRGGLSAGRQLCAPQLAPRLDIEGAQPGVLGCHDKDETARGCHCAAEIERPQAGGPRLKHAERDLPTPIKERLPRSKSGWLCIQHGSKCEGYLSHSIRAHPQLFKTFLDAHNQRRRTPGFRDR
jgi:hypothetical protein